MKFVLILAALIAVAWCESCSYTNDCLGTACIHGYTLECRYSRCECTKGAGSGTGHTGGGCQTSADCRHLGECPSGSLHHCINHVCLCGA